MPLLFDGKPTKPQAGDILVMDVDNDTVSLERDGKPIVRDDKSDDYFISVADGLQIEEFVELIADACGLEYEELGLEGDSWRFRFI